MVTRRERFKAIGVINTSDVLRTFGSREHGEDLAVIYHGYDRGRGGKAARSQIWSPYYETNPDANWYDHGKKTFPGSRLESFPKAIAWACAKTKTKPEDWAPCPVDPAAYIRTTVRARVLKALKAAKKAKA